MKPTCINIVNNNNNIHKRKHGLNSEITNVQRYLFIYHTHIQHGSEKSNISTI